MKFEVFVGFLDEQGRDQALLLREVLALLGLGAVVDFWNAGSGEADLTLDGGTGGGFRILVLSSDSLRDQGWEGESVSVLQLKQGIAAGVWRVWWLGPDPSPTWLPSEGCFFGIQQRDVEGSLKGVVDWLSPWFGDDGLDEEVRRTLKVGWLTPICPRRREALALHMKKVFGDRVHDATLLTLLVLLSRRLIADAHLFSVLGLSTQAGASVLKRIQQAGLLDWLPSPFDGRRKWVRLTAVGREWVIDALRITHSVG